MTAGVMRLSPSQDTPRTAENESGPMAARYVPASTSSKTNVPSASVVVPTQPSSAVVAQLDDHARQAELTFLDLARRAATGLEVPPHDAGDPARERLRHNGLLGVGGHLGRADPREPELSDAAGLEAARARDRPAVLLQLVGRRLGADRTPEGDTTSFTTAMAALIVPCSILLVISRQITPAANSEIAIGMKTATLNATENRMRSSRTAKTSPIAVTNAGTTRIQRRLFWIAVRSVSSVKSAS